jgi:hypothetical protein
MPALARALPQAESGSPAVPVAAQPQLLNLNDGTAVRVRTTAFISSKKAKTGDPLEFRVAADVKIGNLVVISRGAIAHGRVAEAQKNRMLGRAGKLVLAINSVEALNGTLIPLRATHNQRGEGYTGKVGDVALGYAERTPLGVGGVAAAPLLLFKGDNADIAHATTFLAYVNGDARFSEAELRNLQPPLKPATGLATVYIYRFQTAGDKNSSVYCGAVEIGKLLAKHYVEVQLPPGQYVFRSPDVKSTVQLKAEPDQTYYIHFFPKAFLTIGGIQ